MKNRIHMLISNEGLSLSRFAEIINVQPSAISHILSGRNNPGYEIISSILTKFPNINARWLLLGENEMYDIQRKSVEKNISLFNPSNEKPKIGKSIERIVIFYSDHTFDTYNK